MESNKFEDSFRNAFVGAEVLPSDAVWTNIELDLEKASGGKLKRNLLMFQLLAAASAAFALGIAGLYYLEPSGKQDDFFVKTQRMQNIDPVPEVAKESADQKISSEEVVVNDGKRKSTDQKIKSLNNDNELHTVADQYIKAQPENSAVEYKINRKDLSAFVQTKKTVLRLPKEEEPVEPDAGMVLLARLKDEEKKYQEEDKTSASNEKLWASVGVGAGSYKPNRQVLSEGNASSGSVTGESYTLTFSIAGKISKRVFLQGGISYLTQNADFTSASSNKGAASLSEYYRPALNEAHSPGNPQNVGPDSYQLNSSLQFVSIPVQAGFLLVDRTFSVQLNGGISTDLFISNTLTPATDYYQKVTQAAGQDSPYRTVNFSGLAGTEFSYKIADRYRISVNPGLRYSLHSIYKEGVAAEITPVTFDVSLRFRYIFK